MGTNHKPITSLWDRFHLKLDKQEDGCWRWIGAKKELGYGVIGLGTRAQGTIKAHRAAWQLYNGEIPDGLAVLHRCDRPDCVNPSHLFLGTLSDNMRDCVSKGRNFIPDNRGERAPWHKLTKEQAKEILAAKATRTRWTGMALARKFGVSRSAIYRIWEGKNWRGV